MKKFLVKTFVVASLLAPLALFADKKDLMVIVTTGDGVTQTMSIVLSSLAKEEGAKVNVLFCGKAGDLVVKSSKNSTPPMQKWVISELIEKGIPVEICPPYLKSNGKTKENLIKGVKVAKPKMVAKKLIDKNTQILSY